MMDEGQTTYCETCEDSVPRALVYPAGTANPAAETQYPLVNNKSYFYTYNFHNSPLTSCQVGNRNSQVQNSPTQGGSGGQATGGATPPPASTFRGGATIPPGSSYRGGAASPPGYANRGDTSPLSSAYRGGATASPRDSYRGGSSMALPPFATDDAPQLQPQYNPTAHSVNMWCNQTSPSYNQALPLYNQASPSYNQASPSYNQASPPYNQASPSPSYNQPRPLAPQSRLSALARSMGSLRLQLEQGPPDRPLQEVFGYVSQKLPMRSWKPLARKLGLSDTDIEVIEHDFPHDAREQKYQMLLLWNECRPAEQHPTAQRPTEQRPTEQRPTEQQPVAMEQTVSCLQDALTAVECTDLADSLRNLYNSTFSGQSANSSYMYNSQSENSYNKQSGYSTYNSQSGYSAYNSQSGSGTTTPKTVHNDPPTPSPDAESCDTASAGTQLKQFGSDTATQPKVLYDEDSM
ncbi:Hypp9018 [Branchiostoma lanceolatum]|uniref:Hypp9018 protein n=1 Tax=Branchiostoma lanceolatum TaxID=7740 RepID=A0A8J9ZD70_BRALA|nr:Hypp9018 [Branchiostoma lanceolatum]